MKKELKGLIAGILITACISYTAVINAAQKVSAVSVKIKCITVSTAEQFVNAIGSNTKIVMKPGIYDLSKIKQLDNKSKTAVWNKVYDGKELVIRNVSKLTIEGAANGKTEIKTAPRYANIFYFDNVKGITINNITAGHTPAKYECNAGVVYISNSSNIQICNSHLYGCGSIGVDLMKVEGFTMKNSVIDHCSLRAIESDDSEHVLFQNCKIINHEAYADILYVRGGQDVNFEQCEFSGNKKLEWSFIELYNAYNVCLNKCKIINNAKTKITEDEDSKMFLIETENSQLVIKNSIISNNQFDYLMNDSDEVTFENCTMQNNKYISEECNDIE